jgi:hypothetical protein
MASTPACSSCGQQMRLASMETHERYSTLMNRTFVCDCGATTSDVFTLPT